MKRLTKIGYIVLGLFFATYSSAFAQADIDDMESLDLGIGLAYGTEIETLGINANAYYPVSDKFLVGGGLTYFFPDDSPGATINWFAVNVNGQYLFYSEENFNAYGLAGLNILIQSINFDEAVGQDNLSETYVGLNLGAGVEYGLGSTDLFGELKLAGIGDDADQLVLSAGLRFNL
ncbi:MAG TPA: outer membrane beta-barrel protein [Balneolaceae bacterium]|nr:outer membrane beta-barrel protein [Balneolaceae bacterium]